MGTGTAAVAPPGAEPDLLDDNGQPMGGEPQLLDDNGHPVGQSPLDDPNSVASRAALSIHNRRLTMMLPPPEPPHLPAVDAFLTGMGRGAVSTGTQIGKFVRGAATRNFGPYDDPGVEEQLHGSNPTSIDPQGGADTAGYYGEKTAELLAPAGLAGRATKALASGSDLVASSGRVLAEIPAITGRLGRAAIAGGVEGVSNAAVTALQTGDPHDAMWAGALGAMTAAPLKYWSKAERVKALIDGVIDPALAKPSAEAGAFVQRALGDARDAAGQALGSEYEKVANAATERVSVGKSLPRIQELISELEDPTKTFPGLGGVDDVSKALGILKSFAEPGAEVSVDDALKVRSLLFKLSNSGNVGIGKGALQQLTQEWHGEIVNALTKQDPALAQQFVRASTQYRQFITTFNSQTIRALIKKGAPERVLDVLMSGSGETTATNLRQMIGPQNMEVVRSSLWQRLLEKSSPGDSTFLATKFDGMLDKLGPEAQRAIFGSEQNVIRMRKFAAMMDTSWMHESAKQSLGKIALRAGTGAAAGIGADRVLEHDGAGGWRVWGPAGAAMALAPALVAKVMARPGTINVLEKAMTTSPASDAGRVIASKLSALIMSADMHGGQRDQGVNGASVMSGLEQGDAARRARARSASALVSGPPPIEGGAQPQTPPPPGSDGSEGMVAYIPRPLENDRMVQTTPPQDYLPARFKKARAALMGTPRRVGATDPPDTLVPEGSGLQAGWDGLYGRSLTTPHTDDQRTNNDILISRSNFDDPAKAKTMWARTLTHEVGHAVWQDLTPGERASWKTLHKNFADYDSEPEDPEHDSYSTKAMYRYTNVPNESFAEQWAHYVVRPSELRAENPEIYAFMKRIAGGKEYISRFGGATARGSAIRSGPPPPP